MYELIKEAFGDAALSRSRTFEWFSRFQKGREKVNDDQHTGRPRSFRCEENKLKIKELIKSNRRISIKDLSPETGLFGEAVRLKRPERWQNNDWILHVGNARPHTAHVVLQFLAKHSTIQIPHPPYSPDLASNDFFSYPKLKMNLKGRKFDNVDMIRAESKATLRNLSKMRLKRPERWQNNDWILHVGNARPHTAHVVLQFLAKHSTIQIPHPPYSPDLASNDFFSYPKLKMNLKGRKFDNVDMIRAESKATLRNLSKSDFISCFDNWKKRWNECIEAGGPYFEKY
ncbi:hypothetical protein LAZ67_15001092 [Cordylochernes scorpioides]|uniref:Mos1 transposase HTH domain-containing protein n=1 Tax=Cordylochernes scorpioides TaxID=51811 RepID=A0ABY6LB27_9ARAC|nr:hypothetical protein LAZ67_15001092 [Cordylochernes scorpioides]